MRRLTLLVGIFLLSVATTSLLALRDYRHELIRVQQEVKSCNKPLFNVDTKKKLT